MLFVTYVLLNHNIVILFNIVTMYNMNLTFIIPFYPYFIKQPYILREITIKRYKTNLI